MKDSIGTAPAEQSARDDSPFYDITEGDWRLVATPTEPGTARIEFTRKGEPFREFLMPSYKVWNISAHFHFIIEDFDEELAQAVANPIEGLVHGV